MPLFGDLAECLPAKLAGDGTAGIKLVEDKNEFDKDFLIFDELVSVSQVEASELARAGIMVVEDEHSRVNAFLPRQLAHLPLSKANADKTSGEAPVPDDDGDANLEVAQ